MGSSCLRASRALLFWWTEVVHYIYLLLFESVTSQTVALDKSQDNEFVSFEMLCLYMEDVNWFYLVEEGKVVSLNCFALIEARFWYDLCCCYFHTYDPLRKVFRNLCEGYGMRK